MSAFLIGRSQRPCFGQMCHGPSLVVVFACLATKSVALLASWTCDPPPEYTASQLEELVRYSCGKVRGGVADFETLEQEGHSLEGLRSRGEWQKASLTCDQAEASRSSQVGAKLALKAWGDLTGGAECCNMVSAPHCSEADHSPRSIIVMVLLSLTLLLVTMLVISSIVAACRSPPTRGPRAPLKACSPSPEAIEAADLPVSHSVESREKHLEEVWLRRSPLRVLPGAERFANATASLFVALQEAFDFQWDSVQNQYEHLLSAWRSQCAMVADRAIGRGEDVDDSTLLREALGDLHADLLEGFGRWRTKLCSYGLAGLPLRGDGEMPLMGIRYSGSSGGDDVEVSVQLAEIATYLLVWGECGNLRFMPEVIYFFTELALASEQGLSASAAPGAELPSFRSNRFLVNVVRPVYNLIFDEWYDSVDVDSNFRDKKKLRAGFETFLPADVANYDDWNELFTDPQRLVDTLAMTDGSALFTLPHSQRFAALSRVDWRASLNAETSKTHREIHSLWGVFASTHRVWLLHAALFLIGVCIVAEDPALSYMEPTVGHTSVLLADGQIARRYLLMVPTGVARFSTMCLIVPLHAMLYFFARWQVTGHAFRRACCGSGFMFWMNLLLGVPCITYALILFLVWTDRGQSTWLILAAIVHYIISFIGLFRLLFMPSKQDQLWTLTGVPFRQRAVRYLFWACVLGVKFALGLLATKAIFTGVEALKLTLPGYETPRDLSHLLFSIQYPAHVLMWLAIWGTSFLFYLTDTQLWFVVGCSFLGVITVCVQKNGRVVKMVLEDAVSKIPERFSKKVLPYTTKDKQLKTSGRGKDLSEVFPYIWDRIIEYMRYEDDIDFEHMGDLSFTSRRDNVAITWANLTRPLKADPETGQNSVKWGPKEVEHSFAEADGQKSAKLCRSGCGTRCQEGRDLTGRAYDTCCRSCAMRPGTHTRDCPGRLNKKKTPSKSPTGSSAGSSVGSPADSAVQKSAAGSSADPSAQRGAEKTAPRKKLKVPDVFRQKAPSEIFVNHYGSSCSVKDPSWPDNDDVQWRLVALARSLSLPMPRPFQAPYIPGLTVLIPHYGESILLREGELWWEEENRGVALVDWLKRHWDDEFKNFHARKQSNLDAHDWPATGNQWEEYTPAQWDALAKWSSMRMQTLWRTVAGMCMYHHALQCHFEAQHCGCTEEQTDGIDRKKEEAQAKGDRLALKSVWDPSDCFTCLVSMQMYKFFGRAELEETNLMFKKFPDCLKIAFIDCEEKGAAGDSDAVHFMQRRRYFSSLIDGDCKEDPASARKQARFRIELPGYPILGDGKSDNQNHAIPFMRGAFAQCIDANQGAYFEQMMLLPCVLGEFRSSTRGDGAGKRIIGLPEHITSDIGSVGDMAASAEHAFGTILQRTYSVLGARMHYGHPDIMNKHYMMQQGGVSKATKTLNLSEDIFAGMDFTLRGEGRSIRHCEYFHLAKGRDLGFNTVLGFFSKLASGAGEQILTRQMFRLGQVLHLPDSLAFHYAHVGYYLNQFLVSWSMPCLMCVWLLVLVSECDETFDAFQYCNDQKDLSAAQIMGTMMSSWFSYLLLLFLFATSLPLFAELWLERSLKTALIRVFKQLATLSPLLFIFQSKVIGHYIVNEIRFGGATYVSTGRGLPTDRRPFIGEVKESGFQLAKVGGLYLDYAQIAYYDGALLLAASILVVVVGGVEAVGGGSLAWLWLSVALIITSWLYAPFIFNPYQFARRRFEADLRAWCAFFTQNRGKHWVKWYEDTQLKPKRVHRFAIDISVFLAAFFLLAWYEVVGFKARSLRNLYPDSTTTSVLRITAILPPVVGSLILSAVIAFVEACLKCWKARTQSSRAGEDEADLEAPAPASGEASMCCMGACPVLFSSILVFVLDISEASFTLQDFYWASWMKAFAAGLVLKYAALSVSLRLAESLLRTQCFRCCTFFSSPLTTWVRAHRMCRDVLTSSLILIFLAPWVLLNSLNECCCFGCSVHKLLIYRDAGHFAREKLDVKDFEPRKARTRLFGGSEISGWPTERSSRYGSEQSEAEPSPAARLIGTETATPKSSPPCVGSRKWRIASHKTRHPTADGITVTFADEPELSAVEALSSSVGGVAIAGEAAPASAPSDVASQVSLPATSGASSEGPEALSAITMEVPSGSKVPVPSMGFATGPVSDAGGDALSAGEVATAEPSASEADVACVGQAGDDEGPKGTETAAAVSLPITSAIHVSSAVHAGDSQDPTAMEAPTDSGSVASEISIASLAPSSGGQVQIASGKRPPSTSDASLASASRGHEIEPSDVARKEPTESDEHRDATSSPVDHEEAQGSDAPPTSTFTAEGIRAVATRWLGNA